MDTKRCPSCKITKPLSEWGKDRHRKDGLNSKCKACDADHAAAYYAKNRDRILARQHAQKATAPAQELTAAREAARRALRARYRAAAEAVYGGCCERCGAGGPFQFDHVDNDGAAHRLKEAPRDMVQRIAATGERLDDFELQLLCNDCHKVKTKQTWARSTYCARCLRETR